MSWLGYNGFALPNCLPCCDAAGECYCKFIIPLAAPIYTGYTAARDALDDEVVDCVGWFGPTYGFTPTRTLDLSVANTVTASESNTGAPLTVESMMFGAVVMLKTGTLSFNWDFSWIASDVEDAISSAIIQITPAIPSPCGPASSNCSASSDQYLETFTNAAQTITGSDTFTVPSDGTYYVLVELTPTGSTYNELDSWSGEFSMSDSSGLYTRPVVALYSADGNCTDQVEIEACPKMLLPPLTESTGDWYADETDAQAILDDTLLVSNCIGYSEQAGTYDTFTATEGVSDLELAWSAAGDVEGVIGWASLNALEGETLEFDWTFAATTGASVNVSIYDYNGILVELLSSASSPITSSTIPYSGRYIVSVEFLCTSPSETTDASVSITSSGTVSFNPVQPLYDVGATCPATLDCV